MRDLIDRAEAIEEIARRDTTDGTIKVYSGREVVKILNSLPSAQPEKAQLSGEDATKDATLDCISRKMAIDALYIQSDDDGWWTGTAEDMENLLKALPSAQPTIEERKWIPCSERVPDLWDEKYLVSLAWGGVGTMEYKSTGFHNYGSFSPVSIETVTAWMPLPEPYKEGNT